ncbi:MAG TPA: hypothetical protein VN618_08405 [Solirubrobacteraceae bacterium]|nr:hypothetical protein [Solirubrobacteraceae bacterium]
MARIRHSFTIGEPPAEAQEMFVRDILPSLYKGTAYRLTDERPGRLVFSDGAVDVNRVFDARRVAVGEDTGRRRLGEPAAPLPPPGERPRPRVAGIVAPNVEHRQPWLYASLRGAMSRRVTVRFEAEAAAAKSRTWVEIRGSAPRPVRDALSRLGEPGEWPETADRPHG